MASPKTLPLVNGRWNLLFAPLLARLVILMALFKGDFVTFAFEGFFFTRFKGVNILEGILSVDKLDIDSDEDELDDEEEDELEDEFDDELEELL